MSSVLFDFDSTITPYESLELLLKTKITDSAIAPELTRITERGMSGLITFQESLEQRLALVQPTQQEMIKIGKYLAINLTKGIVDVIDWLQANNVDIWIVSGGFEEAILPTAVLLNIPLTNIICVQAKWHANGNYNGLIDNYSNKSKLDAVRNLISKKITSPSVMIGDGMTDYKLCENKLVENFILYTEHAKRKEVIEKSKIIATTMAETKTSLTRILSIT